MAAQDDGSYIDPNPVGGGGIVVGGGDAAPGPVAGGGVDPLDPYPEGVPDFRNDQSGMGPPDPNHYDPNEDVDQFGYQVGINGEKNYDVNVGMTGGLMDTINRTGNLAGGAGRGTAVNRGVQKEELSQWQLQQMLASDSPLMQQQANMGLARGGSRGLMNSSLSTGAAQGAMIAGAQPFAMADADRYGTTAADNMNATNSMEEQNMRERGMYDRQVLAEQLSGFGDIRKAMINVETREDGQQYDSEQNQMNRDWTSNENLLSNTLAQWQTKMDVAARLGVSREQAYSEMYASIMSNPDKKFSAAERAEAVERMGKALSDRYAETDEVEPGPFETSVLNGTPDDSQMLPPAALPGETQTVSGGTTVTQHLDGSTTIHITSGNPQAQQEYNSLPDVG